MDPVDQILQIMGRFPGGVAADQKLELESVLEEVRLEATSPPGPTVEVAIVLTAPNHPEHGGGFIEVEDLEGHGLKIGRWDHHPRYKLDRLILPLAVPRSSICANHQDYLHQEVFVGGIESTGAKTRLAWNHKADAFSFEALVMPSGEEQWIEMTVPREAAMRVMTLR